VEIGPLVEELENISKTGAVSSANEASENAPEDSSNLEDLISMHRSETKEMNTPQPGVAPPEIEAPMEVEQVTESGVSHAALESLKEQVADGLIDASVLDEFKEELSAGPSLTAPVTEKAQKIEPQNIKEEVVQSKVEENKPAIVPEKIEEKVKVPVEQPSASKAPSSGSIADSTVRVQVSTLEKIMNIVGELVLNRNQVIQTASQLNDPEMNRLSNQLNTITSELQSEVMITRMQPIGNILTKFERLVRDLSKQNDKRIKLDLSGQDTDLDRTLIEAIKDPLVHIIRNCCDHGIENIEERKNTDKPEVGTISVKAYNESGQVTIEVSDDGRGLNKERIVSKALEKNVITPGQLETMDDQSIYSLVLAPGFSTAEKVTNISGRGVGMDVVKSNIEKIGGSVALTSVPGVGSCFKLRIPLTLAIIPALIVRSKGEFFAIPQLNLVELVRLEGEDRGKLIENIQSREFLRLRGSLTPLFRINSSLELEEVNKKSKAVNSLLPDCESANNLTNRLGSIEDSENIVILSADDHVYALVVDEILDTQEIVVKPLSSVLKDIVMFGGATIMGDGRVALILDASGFLRKSLNLTNSSLENTFNIASSKASVETPKDTLEFLLFSLRDKQKYAIPLALVTRLEEFPISSIERTGNQHIVRYLDKPLPLIDVEKTLTLSNCDTLADYLGSRPEETKIHCIVTSYRNKNFALVVEKILDIFSEEAKVEADAVDRSGIEGTIFINEKIVNVLDLISIVKLQKIGAFRDGVEGNEETNFQKSVLLVDDSSFYRRVEAEALKELGIEVTTAVDGSDALNKLSENQSFDVIITDIEMPVLDGWGLVEQLKEVQALKEIPIIALTTKYSIADRERSETLGIEYHLEKFNKSEVKDVLKIIFNNKGK
jgi:two-component system, chemotaxis family, sensor kinase CheA